MANVSMTVAELRALGDPTELDLGHSEGLVVDQARIDAFADATLDHQWIHVDTSRAASGPFGTTIAHGYLTLSLVPRFLEDLLEVSDQVRGTNYGIESARFTDVVPSGSELVMSGRVTGVTAGPDGGVRYRVAVEMRVVGASRPCLVAEIVYLAYDS
jgi:acyl dehydratase